ncbi:hybrid sensor histidine kinase/response regulator [Arcobacter roscoffensis]|uniref:histidine kinase n=1 Tax=Arcobacter roscoffensis TaxID=2961520 RepID=A0ABY5E9Q9_9BACT|nr:hybrid sensor histidine kinase/response regulator [Arcobacter roscoffensis]UTJ07448.1 hybrid sensor histidine kinase/response regulator [Arcobacter roscoffensis]
MNRKYTVLIIDDKIENLKYLKEILKDETYELKATPDALFAIESAKQKPPNLILLDIKMPNIDGFEVCKIVKQDEKLKDIPIIFISALDDVSIKVKAFEQGGVDYITKPFEQEEVKARIRTQLEIYENKQTISKLLNQQDFFLKKIIHEINTPLSVISLNVDNLEEQIGQKEQLEVIKASSKSLSSIYNDLYFLTKKKAREKSCEKIDLVSFLSSRIQFFDEIAKTKNLHIHLEIDKEFELFMDRYELERVIDNTISNAIKYSYENKDIEIILDYKNQGIIEIKNKGIIIEDKDSIFKAYYQQKDKNIGLGLGLSIVKEICKNNQIQIDINSSKEETSFSYIFPKNMIKEVL